MSSNRDSPLNRPATGEELEELPALARRTINASYRAFLGDEAVDRFVNSGASDAHVAHHLDQHETYCLTRDGRTVGFTLLEGPTLDLLMVEPDLHRRGLGRVLLRHAEDTLLGRYESIRLETFDTNTVATLFYEACGWSPGTRTEADGMTKIEYTRTRPDPGNARA